MPTLIEIHGKGKCHICKKPKAGPGEMICSYPHGMIPEQPIGDTGMWSWKRPDAKTEANS